MGGPPLVSPIRVKIGGSDINEEEEERIIRLIVIAPWSIIKQMSDELLGTNL